MPDNDKCLSLPSVPESSVPTVGNSIKSVEFDEYLKENEDMAILKALKKIVRSTEDFDLSSILEIRIKINPDEMLSEAEEELVNEINSLHSELQQLHIEELKLKNKQEFKEPYLAELESCQLTGPITGYLK